ncbi:hypothetical protein EJ05DRAFT_221889 [Pseudovirgaria hyperparasitica]|uniref:Uncharacterized protein n=1 Tax=Pseudovirgaria hyperparasitica TaxID=470096 RepID=A0A6A6VWC9_9PEZI|nr:uncharacterized protein EJ05DRAFT_221889 [Pseudovirgaria hyperparasitica]KAF2753557.1 hypothetical protein EJ05DRAFT_221889 [Pseudovirgaria hyperparasitica]
MGKLDHQNAEGGRKDKRRRSSHDYGKTLKSVERSRLNSNSEGSDRIRRDESGRIVFPIKRDSPPSTPGVTEVLTSEPIHSPTPASENAAGRDRKIRGIVQPETPKKRKHDSNEVPQKRKRGTEMTPGARVGSEDLGRRAEIKRLMATIEPRTKAGRAARKEVRKDFDDEIEKLRLQSRAPPRTPRKSNKFTKSNQPLLKSSLSSAVHGIQCLIQRPAFHESYLQSFVNAVGGSGVPDMRITVEEAKKQFGTAALLCAMNGLTHEDLCSLLDQLKGSLQLVIPRIA